MVAEKRIQYVNGSASTTNVLMYQYDCNGQLYSFKYNGVPYYSIRNIFGDIKGIYESDGSLCALYEYDPFGNHKVLNASGVVNTSGTFIGNINPFRYKGYYYDVETGLFMMGHRYYSPELCRFIQPSNISSLNPHSINGLNLYCYANNNPIRYFRQGFVLLFGGIRE